MPNPENIKPHRWKPGQSGNPSGKPKGTLSLTNRLRKLLNEEDGRLADRLVQELISHATKGERQAIEAIRVVLDRVDGPVKQHLQHEGEMIQKRIIIDGSKLEEAEE